MNIEKLLNDKNKQLDSQKYIQFTPEELNSLRLDQTQVIIDKFHGKALIKIPATEIEFFEWLKSNDPQVWDDLWEDEEDVYLVSIDLLPQFIEGGQRFPICDLVDQPNYWFNARHIKPKGMEALENIVSKLEAKQKLKLAEAFLLELSMAPTDIWHFCFDRKMSISRMRNVVEELVYNGWLVHLPDREDLVKYIDI